MSLPWWLNPWGALRSQAAGYERRIDDLCITAEMDTATIATLESQLRVISGRNTELQRQLAISAGTLDENGRPTTGRALLGYDQPGAAKPEFVIVGLDRGPDGGWKRKRIYVSRELGGASFGIPQGASPVWNLNTSMGNMLVIDAETYGAAMEQMAATWRNWDAEAASQHRPGKAPGQLPPGVTPIPRPAEREYSKGPLRPEGSDPRD